MSTYAVDKACRRVVLDPEFRARLHADPESALRSCSPALSEEELRCLLAGDVGRLGRLGANHFLLHQLGRWEVLGLTLPEYARRIREEYREERERRAAERRE